MVALSDNQSPLYSLGLQEECHAMFLEKHSVLHSWMSLKEYVMDHDSVMLHLHRQGITGNLWKCYNNLYTNITSKIKWQGEESEPFDEGQGIKTRSANLHRNLQSPIKRIPLQTGGSSRQPADRPPEGWSPNGGG